VSDTSPAGSAPEFAACGQCPTREACGVAEFCVTESRFGRADLSIGELTCRSCDRGSESAWACAKGGDCDANSQLWGQWFLVRLYANDARNARTENAQPSITEPTCKICNDTGVVRCAEQDGTGVYEQACPEPVHDDAGAADDWEPCDHDHGEGCYDYQGFFACRHMHCMNCGGCGCPGYCDDYQTYNFRPEETGGAPVNAAATETAEAGQ